MADVPLITDLMRRVSTDAIGEPDANEDEVHDDLIGPRFDLTRDTSLVVDAAGRAVLYGQGYDEHDDRGYVDVFVDPALDDELFATVAARAVAAAQQRIRESLAERGAASTTAAAGVYRGEHRMLRAYEDAGFKRERVYWRMSVDVATRHDLETELESALTEGVSIRAVDPDDDEVMAAALRLRNDTFSEHHGHADMTLADYTEVWRTSVKYDRKAWWFAYLGGEAVGICLGDEAKADEGVGYIRSLGVTKNARGRGIARALLLTAFAEYRSRGRESVQLGVDSSNETGAIRLYESVGMKPVLVIDALAMTLSAAQSG